MWSHMLSTIIRALCALKNPSGHLLHFGAVAKNFGSQIFIISSAFHSFLFIYNNKVWEFIFWHGLVFKHGHR